MTVYIHTYILLGRWVVGSGGIFVGKIDGGGILCGGSGAGGMRGEYLVRRNGFEVLEVLTGRGVIGGVCTSNTSNSLRQTRFSPRVSPAPLPPYSTPSPSQLSLEVPPPPTTTLLSNNTSPPTTNPHTVYPQFELLHLQIHNGIISHQLDVFPSLTLQLHLHHLLYSTIHGVELQIFSIVQRHYHHLLAPPSTPNTEDNITLFQLLLIDPVFDSIRPFTREIIASK
jgi:hypothetical protein